MKKFLISLVVIFVAFFIIFTTITRNPIDNNFSNPNEGNKLSGEVIENKETFDLEKYIVQVNSIIESASGESIIDIELTADIYGDEVTEFKDIIQVDSVLANVMTDNNSFITIIPMPDFLDNQSYYFSGDEFLAYKRDFMGIGGSVTYYFNENTLVSIDKSKIEPEMQFIEEASGTVLQRSKENFEKFLK